MNFMNPRKALKKLADELEETQNDRFFGEDEGADAVAEETLPPDTLIEEEVLEEPLSDEFMFFDSMHQQLWDLLRPLNDKHRLQRVETQSSIDELSKQNPSISKYYDEAGALIDQAISKYDFILQEIDNLKVQQFPKEVKDEAIEETA
jgi:hypothetical protein